MSEELGPSNLLLGNATTADEAEQMTEAMPRKIPSTHETMAAQTSTSKHDQKHTTSPASWTHALECTWPAWNQSPAAAMGAEWLGGVTLPVWAQPWYALS